MEMDYDVGVDMWALGCITGELFKMVGHKSKEYSKIRGPLFLGSKCFPLSPGKIKAKHIEENTIPVSHHDQLFKILSLIGTPSKMDRNFISDITA